MDVSAHWDIHQIGKIHNSDFIKLSENELKRIQNNRDYLEEKIKDNNAVIYGINTGFGSLCNIRISNTELEELQENLVLSHACGMGDKIPHNIARLILLLKIKNFSKAVSGVRTIVVEKLIELYNQNITPVIYEMGSLGASGDLAPLAHLSLPLLGRGEVYSESGTQKAAEVLQKKSIEPIKLKAKEGLALLNGTQFSLAFAATSCLEGLQLFHFYNEVAALSMEAFGCSSAPLDESIQNIRPHEGQVLVAKTIRDILAGSQLNNSSYSVQDPYSFRCVPQVHGATFTALKHAREVIETELNSATDNPNIFDEEDKILSGGNFHAQPLALILDYMGIAMAELGNISERRVYQLINGDRGLPAFLAPEPGLHSGFMIAQYTAASIVSQNKQLATPASVDSIISSKGQEDHVSMAANAGTKCYKIVRNVKMLLAIEWLTACQALAFRDVERTSPKIKKLYTDLRNQIPFMDKDRLLHDDLVKALEIVDFKLKDIKI